MVHLGCYHHHYGCDVVGWDHLDDVHVLTSPSPDLTPLVNSDYSVLDYHFLVVTYPLLGVCFAYFHVLVHHHHDCCCCPVHPYCFLVACFDCYYVPNCCCYCCYCCWVIVYPWVNRIVLQALDLEEASSYRDTFVVQDIPSSFEEGGRTVLHQVLPFVDGPSLRVDHSDRHPYSLQGDRSNLEQLLELAWAYPIIT